MDIWIARKAKGRDTFVAEERVSLSGFEDLFEDDLATHGSHLTLRIPQVGQDVELRGRILPGYGQLRRSGRAKAIESRVRESLSELASSLDGRGRGPNPGAVGLARDAVALLDALTRAKRPYQAIVVG